MVTEKVVKKTDTNVGLHLLYTNSTREHNCMRIAEAVMQCSQCGSLGRDNVCHAACMGPHSMTALLATPADASALDSYSCYFHADLLP